MLDFLSFKNSKRPIERKITIELELPEKIIDLLHTLSEDQEKSLDEIVCQALEMESFYRMHVLEGAIIAIHRKDGNVIEVIPK